MNLFSPGLRDVLWQASDRIMDIYDQDMEVSYKEDNSPLTQADMASHQLITQYLQQATPTTPILSEEGKEILYAQRRDREQFRCIDPLDGTKEFIKKNGEFTINLAFVHGGQPVFGVIVVPAQGEMYVASKGQGIRNYTRTEMTEITFPTKNNPDTIRIVASRSHRGEEMDGYIHTIEQQYKHIEYVSAGSALKFVKLATGQADLYPRCKPCMERDTAAGHVLLREVGKDIYHRETGEPLQYNKEHLVQPRFVAK